MSLDAFHNSDPIKTIDHWFMSRCNGLWEHCCGLRLESTDNPGWLITIDESIDQMFLKRLLPKVKALNAEVTTDNTVVTVWSSSLSNCVQAVAVILAERTDTQVTAGQAFSLGDRVQVSRQYPITHLQGAIGVVANPPYEIATDNHWFRYWRTEVVSSGKHSTVYWIRFEPVVPPALDDVSEYIPVSEEAEIDENYLKRF